MSNDDFLGFIEESLDVEMPERYQERFELYTHSDSGGYILCEAGDDPEEGRVFAFFDKPGDISMYLLNQNDSIVEYLEQEIIQDVPGNKERASPRVKGGYINDKEYVIFDEENSDAWLRSTEVCNIKELR